LARGRVVVKVPVFLGSQADGWFHFSASLKGGFGIRRCILSPVFSGVIASVAFVVVAPLSISASQRFSYADAIVLSNRVCRAALRLLSESRFRNGCWLWANPSFHGTLRDETAQRP